MNSLFSTRTLQRVLEILKPAQSFILDTFFPEEVFSSTEFVDIDIVKGRRKLAPLVHPLHEGSVDTRQGYTTNTIKVPYIKPKRPTSAADVLQRAAGENPYSAMNAQQRAALLLTNDTRDLMDQIVRREEFMAVEALFKGEITVKGEGFNGQVIDLQMAANHKLANTALNDNGWATAATALPLDDLDDFKIRIAQDSGQNAVEVIMGSTAFKLFMASSQVKDELNNRRIDGNVIVAQSERTGAILHGVMRGYRIFTYNEWYEDNNGDEQPMIDPKKVMMGSTVARAVRHYGAIQDLDIPSGSASVRFFPKSWRMPDPSVQWLMIQSAPLPVPHEVDAFLFASVIA